MNRKLLEVERVSQHCVLTQAALDRLRQPTVEAGQRTAALRFGDRRVMALFQAITGSRISRAGSVTAISVRGSGPFSAGPLPPPSG